ncbi:MAG TPA: PAS domain-containing protein, partial [Gemmatales bacterium]|nr:PAS domain-containing protein [Gemmatales bacterium]
MSSPRDHSYEELLQEVEQLQAELSRTKKALEASQLQHQLISKAINSVIIDWNLETNQYERVNSLELVMGYRLEEIEHTPAWTRSTVHPEDLPKFDKAIQESLCSDAHELHLDVRCRHKDGSYRHLRGQAAIHRDPFSKRARRIIVCYRDITREIEAHQALQNNEERYRLATDAIDGIVFDRNLETDYVYRSTGVERVLGYGPAEIHPHVSWWISLIHPEDVHQVLKSTDTFLASRETHGYLNYRIRHRDGHYLKVHSNFIAMRNHQGKAIRLVGCIVDISDRLEAEQAQQAAEQSFRQLFQAIPLGLVVIAPHQQIVETNMAFASTLGYTQAELRGLTMDKLLVTNSWNASSEPVESAEDTGFDYASEALLLHKNGSPVPAYVRGIKVKYPEYDQPCQFCIIEDLSARRTVEQEKENLERHLQEMQKLESLGVLAGGIAHDFNNLLTVILGNLSLLKQEPVQKHIRQDALLHAEQASLQAAELCRQMLAYAGRGKIENKPFDISQLVESSQALLSSAASKHHTIHYHLSKGLPSIVGDPSQVRQILLNLVHNAAEAFTRPGGTIDVMTGVEALNDQLIKSCLFHQKHQPGSYVWLEIRDNGPGMEPAVSKRIFEPFFTTKFTGRGLGLAAVAGILRTHKGLLAYHSEPNAGTCFRIYFPAHSVLAQEITTSIPSA